MDRLCLTLVLLLLLLLARRARAFYMDGVIENQVLHHTMSAVINGQLFPPSKTIVRFGVPPPNDDTMTWKLVIILTEDYSESGTQFAVIMAPQVRMKQPFTHVWRLTERYGTTVGVSRCNVDVSYTLLASGTAISSPEHLECTWLPAFRKVPRDKQINETNIPAAVLRGVLTGNKQIPEQMISNVYNGVLTRNWGASISCKIQFEKYTIESLEDGDEAYFMIETALSEFSSRKVYAKFDVIAIPLSFPWLQWIFRVIKPIVADDLDEILHQMRSEKEMRVALNGGRALGSYKVYDGRLYNGLKNYTLFFARERAGYGEHINFVVNDNTNQLGRMNITLIPMVNGNIAWDKEFFHKEIDFFPQQHAGMEDVDFYGNIHRGIGTLADFFEMLDVYIKDFQGGHRTKQHYVRQFRIIPKDTDNVRCIREVVKW